MNPTTKAIYLVRHAQSHLSPQVSNKDWPLSRTGRIQAQELAAVLQPLEIERVYSSPYLRCRQTIEPFIKAEGLPIVLIDDLREQTVSLEIRDDFMEIWTRSWDDFDFALDGCESSHQCQQRIVRVLTEIASSSSSSRIAISTHGNAIGLFLNHITSEFGRTCAERMRNPDIFDIEFNNNTFQWKHESGHDALKEFATDVHKTPIDSY